MDNNHYDDPEVVTLSAPEQEMVKVQNPNSANLFVINIGTLSFGNMQSSSSSQKIHGPVRMDRFKMTERVFFDTYPKWVFLDQNFK
jgi:hypothetical protein